MKLKVELIKFKDRLLTYLSYFGRILIYGILAFGVIKASIWIWGN